MNSRQRRKARRSRRRTQDDLLRRYKRALRESHWPQRYSPGEAAIAADPAMKPAAVLLGVPIYDTSEVLP